MLPSPHAAGDMAAAGGLCFFEDGSGLGGWPDLADLRSALEPLLPLPRPRRRRQLHRRRRPRKRGESAVESNGGGGGDSSCAEDADRVAIVPRAVRTETTVTQRRNMLWCGGGGKGALESSGERSEKQLRLTGGSGEEGTEAGKVSWTMLRRKKSRRRRLLQLPWNKSSECDDEEDDDLGVEVRRHEVQRETGSSRLHKILGNNDEITAKSSCDVVTTPVSATSSNGSILERGSHMVKSGLRRIGVFSSSNLKKLNGGCSEDEAGSSGGLCSSSQDSGLGEESDFDPATRGSSTSPRSPTPGGISSTAIRPSTSSLRKVSSASSSSTAAGPAHLAQQSGKKHVMILEPNLIELPRTKRLIRENGHVKRLETVRIVETVSRRQMHTTPKCGNVSSQWLQLYEAARAEVVRRVKGCDGLTVSLIFEPDSFLVCRGVEGFVDVASLVHTVYMIISHDWLRRNSGSSKGNVTIIVHCVQAFIVIVADVALDEEEGTNNYLKKRTKELAASCQQSGYSDLAGCLAATRRLYVDLWCALMEVRQSAHARWL